MHQPLQPSQVHKRTERTEIGHPALAYIARTETIQQVLAAALVEAGGPFGKHKTPQSWV